MRQTILLARNKIVEAEAQIDRAYPSPSLEKAANVLQEARELLEELLDDARQRS